MLFPVRQEVVCLLELLYADDLVIIAPTMEQLGRRVADWRASLLGKGLKVNAGKSKVMVGSSGGKMIVNSGKWPWCLWEKSTVERILLLQLESEMDG